MYNPLHSNLAATNSPCSSPINWNVNISITPDYTAQLAPTYTPPPPPAAPTVIAAAPPPPAPREQWVCPRGTCNQCQGRCASSSSSEEEEEEEDDAYDEYQDLQQMRWYQSYRNLRRTSELM